MSCMTDQVLRDVESVIATIAGDVSAARMLDIGCWDGRATEKYALACNSQETLGVEIFEGPAAEAEARGVSIRRVDLESGKLPFDDGTFDLVICNQVFEHLKNIFDLISEVHRIMRNGGDFIFSVPNLASVHNRVLALFGAQPTSIRIIGPHVRGFSYRHTKRFLTLNGLFELRGTYGCGFYPFPISVGRPLGRLWKGGSHTVVYCLRKSGKEAPDWRQAVSEAGYQTVFSSR